MAAVGIELQTLLSRPRREPGEDAEGNYAQIGLVMLIVSSISGSSAMGRSSGGPEGQDHWIVMTRAERPNRAISLRGGSLDVAEIEQQCPLFVVKVDLQTRLAGQISGVD
jgi:hypothetical protein